MSLNNESNCLEEVQYYSRRIDKLFGVTSRSPKLKARKIHDIYRGDETESSEWLFGALLGCGAGGESK